MTDFTARQLDASIAAQVTSLRQDASPLGHASLADLIRQRSEALGSSEFTYLLQDPSGIRIAGTLPQVAPSNGWLYLPFSLITGIDGDSEHDFRALGTLLDDGSFLLVARDTFQLDEAFDLMERIFGWGFAVTLVLAFVGGAVVSAGFRHRLENINRTCGEIINGNLSRRIPTSGTDDDFDVLSTNLNRMLEQIETLMENLRQVSNDIAHDLRTPLSRLRQRLEGVRSTARALTDYEAANDLAIDEVDALLATFNALLRIAQIESGSRRSEFTTVDLAAVARAIVETYAPVAEDRGDLIKESFVPTLPVPVPGDRELLIQLLANLVENALCHTPSGTTITVLLRAADDTNGPRLIVSDNGPGIPANERSKVLRRFHRLDPSRALPGYGLGLSLVAAVADLHQATVTLEDNMPGLRVTIGF